MDALWALVGTVVGAGIGAYVTMQVQTRRDQADRRRQASVILGRVRAWIDDGSPDKWAFNADAEKSQAALETVREEWRALRPLILTLRALYPDHASQIEEIYTTCDNLRVETLQVVTSVLENRDDLEEWRARAVASQARARLLANALMEHVGKA